LDEGLLIDDDFAIDYLDLWLGRSRCGLGGLGGSSLPILNVSFDL
jgi:hypothetical protein